MKRIYYTFWLAVLFVALTSTIYSTKNQSKLFEFPPENDSLVLNLPSEPYDYRDIHFPDHVLNFLSNWGADTSTLNTLTNEGATLGRVLFYDVRLSGDNTLSCGSCHKQEFSFADNVALSDGIAGQFTNRNSSQLNDFVWQSGQLFFWDMRSFSLENAVIQPILATNELGKNMPNLIAKLENTTFYPELFEQAFGSPEITEDAIASALSQFIRSMTTFNSRFDQEFESGFSDFTASEMNGFTLFSNNCEMCHFSPHFGAGTGFGDIFMMGTNGLDSIFTDLGVGEWTGDPFFNGVFKGPTLKNIAVTAPYMHDGRFETLSDVIDFYSEGIQPSENSMFNWMFGEDFPGFEFSDSEKEDLEAFLNTLTDNDFLTHEKWSNPWSSTVAVDPMPKRDLFEINVFPNPVGDFFNIEFKNPDFKEFNIELYNSTGQLIKSAITNGTDFIIKRENLPSGVYKLKVSDQINSQTKNILFN
jgi:cytochrome c peroxidase